MTFYMGEHSFKETYFAITDLRVYAPPDAQNTSTGATPDFVTPWEDNDGSNEGGGFETWVEESAGHRRASEWWWFSRLGLFIVGSCWVLMNRFCHVLL